MQSQDSPFPFSSIILNRLHYFKIREDLRKQLEIEIYQKLYTRLRTELKEEIRREVIAELLEKVKVRLNPDWEELDIPMDDIEDEKIDNRTGSPLIKDGTLLESYSG